MFDEDLIVIPLATSAGGVTHALARLVSEGSGVFADMVAVIQEWESCIEGKRV